MLENCTLSGNSASTGGGIDAGNGGGIFGAATLTNCTLSRNSARDYGGGISGPATLTNCTLSGNSASSGGGISGAATLENTIIANSPRGRNCASSASLQSNGHNLDDDAGCGFFNTGDLSLVPPNLAPLGNYGGPTQTHALCTGPGVPHPDCQAASPAIDAGANAHCPATDQRGAARPHGSVCDIGAYESGAQPPQATPCLGDCDGLNGVTVDEIITLVNVALGTSQLSTCAAGDTNHDGQITIDEILTAVNNALNGCAAG
jgi:predicted outer membrane repeat protein